MHSTCILHPGFYIPYRHRMHAYVYASLRRFITSTYSYRARAHARNATTSSCVVTPTATAHALHNLNPGGRTGHICNVAPCTYNLHVHMHRNCACAFNLHSHLGRNAPPRSTPIMLAARHLQQHNPPLLLLFSLDRIVYNLR